VRFGATAAGSANLKGSAEMPPLRQAAGALCVMRRERCRKSIANQKKLYRPKKLWNWEPYRKCNGFEYCTENEVQAEKVSDLSSELKTNCNPKMKRN
jgi:hypothetical protein